MHAPRLSVIAPTYNRAHMLPRFLESVKSITTPCEVLIVDNASTDGTEDVVNRFAQTDPRIRYIRNTENIGPIANYNRAMELARGEFLCCMGDDDAVLPGNFERKLALLHANPHVGLVYSQWFRIDEHGRSQGVCMWPGLLRHSYIGGRSEFLDLLPACYMHLQGVVFRRDLFEQHGGCDLRPEITAGHDWDMLLRWVYHTETAYIAEPLVAVGIHAQSHTESIGRANGHFAPGRIAIWRKWLVENDAPSVLDDSRWQRMREAFLPDLQYEFGANQARIQSFLEQLESIRRESECKITFLFQRSLGDSTANPVVPSEIARPRQESHQHSHPLSVVWHAPLRDPSGYADEARNFLFALDGNSLALAAREIRWNDRIACLSPERERLLNNVIAAPEAPQAIHVWHILASHFQKTAGAAANIGRTMFETDRLPPGWADACNQMDAVWTPSRFNCETFARSGVAREKLRVVPGAIDASRYDAQSAPLRIDGSRGYNFLSVFDWSLRKGWDVLLRAYVEEFSAHEDVALLLKIHSSMGYSLDKIVGAVERFLVDTLGRDPAHIPDIVFQDTTIPDDWMPNLYRAADCFVMPTRGEGWGRPLMEAMAMGLPTIGTNWSGQTEFMNADNSLLLNCEVVEVPEAGWREIPTYRGHCWAEPSVAHLRQMMRRAYEDRTGSQKIGERARHDVLEQFDYSRIAAILAEEFARLR